jgi:sulfur-oxidizing protein SoxB
MMDRREFLAVAGALAALGAGGAGAGGRLLAQGAAQRITQDDLLRFPSKGQVTILHMTDCHAQLVPLYFREPSVNLGAGESAGLPPHLTGDDLLEAFGIEPGSLAAYALAATDFEALARSYGRVGGMDRLATLIGAIRAERGADRTLLLDGGDSLQGSYTALQSKGGDMARVLAALGVEATTGHWEFTLGEARVKELYGDIEHPGTSGLAFFAGNVRENEFEEPVFKAFRIFEKGGIRIGVVGQAFPFTPVAHPRWLVPHWTFGIREADVRRHVRDVRRAGAELVVLLSHNGFDSDRKLARRVAGIDVILTAHTHDALPEPVRVGDTLLIASGSHGKFLSRLDIEVRGGRMVDHAFALIPVLSDAITPDPAMRRLIEEIRAPHRQMLETELARTETLLYRRGNFNGTLDDLICEAILAERDAEIAFSPGFRWGSTLLPGDAITWENVYNATAMSYPTCYRNPMTGGEIKAILEDVADNLFHPDPYYQQGGDMVRVGGLSFAIDPSAHMGNRIRDMTLDRTGERIEAARGYIVAGWASVNEFAEGPPIWKVVASHLQRERTVRLAPRSRVRLVR